MWDWFFKPFADKTWWDIVNSGIVTTFLSASVGIILAGRVRQVALSNEEAAAAAARSRQQLERAEDEAADVVADEAATASEAATVAGAAAPMAVAPADAQLQARARFSRAATAIRSLKDYVDARAARVSDGRVRRRYDNITRRDYRAVIKAIAADGGFVDEELKDLKESFERWRSFRTGKQAVSERLVDEYEALAEKYKVTPKKPERWRPDRARAVQW